MSYDPRTHTRAKQNGPKVTSFPFGNNPVTLDQWTRVHRRNMLVLPNYYFPKSGYSYAPGTRSFTNYGFYADALENAYWSKVGIISVTGSAVANLYDGTSTWAQIIENTSASQHYSYSSATAITSAQSVRFSLFVKSLGTTRIQIFVTDGATNYFSANFDISLGTICRAATGGGAAGTLAATIHPCPSYAAGWYRICVSGSLNGGATSAYFGYSFLNSDSDAITPSYTGTGQAIYAGGAMFERGGISGVAGPYIKTTSAAVSITAPVSEAMEEFDGNDPFAYLVEESDPSQAGGLLAFTRAHARIPGPQITPSSQWFDRPLMDDVFSGGSYAVSFDQRKSWVFTSRKAAALAALANDTKTVTGTVARSGTYDRTGTLAGEKQAFTADSLPATVISIVASTGSSGSFYANDSVGTIYSAFNTLSISVEVVRTDTSLAIAVKSGSTNTIRSLTASSANIDINGIGGSYTFTRRQTAAYDDVTNTADLTDTASITDTHATTETYINPASLRAVTSTAHGGAVGDYVAFWKGDRIVAKSKVILVTSADNFSVLLDDVSGKDLTVDYCGFAPDAAACYVAGPKMCTTRKTATFYLPGVTTGITTYADIPTQVIYTDAQSWLGRIVAGSTWANIAVSDVAQWMGTILFQEITEIQMDDALDTVTP